EAYQSRLILVRAREFEEMKGLSNQIKADLSRVLTDGIGRGLNPREVARNITAQTDIERSRANRIARTEITTALRRARWDEHDQARNDLGLNVMLLHMSALSPTTRRTHALRHGHLYTSDEVREWYSINGNAINCKCTQVTVLVDEKGVPLNSSVIDIAKKEFAQTWGKRMAANKSHHCCKHAA
ncbi:minor capsid protein, partial [Cronobacter sakazakii]|nr:minor capsid protein [Cronobacter sakazakii]EJP5820573.1 minor capsid protein [Cronobacter sakazakii]